MKITKSGITHKRIIQKQRYYDEYMELDEIQLPVVGKQYFVWTDTYVGPDKNRRGTKLLYSNDPQLISDGMPGNSNHAIRRFHGWRGTTDDCSVDALGVRTVLRAERNEYQKTVHYTIVFGPDLAAERE